MVDNNQVHVELDVGNLFVTNVVEIAPAKNRDNSWLEWIASEGVKALFKEISKLPKQYSGNVSVLKLPESTTALPREKPLPKAKLPTRWEQFAQKKGIAKNKKEKLVFDENTKDWKPRYGYKSIKNSQEEWLVELPNNADPNENHFAKKKQQKAEKVAKNEYQRLRNISEATKLKVTNMESVDTANKTQLTKSLAAAKAATASLGKFTKALPKEKVVNSRKRKFEENIPKDVNTEKENYLKILENMNKGKPKLEIKEAVQVQILKKPKKAETSGEVTKKKRKNNNQKKNNKKNNSFNRSKKGNKNKFKKK